MLFAELSKIKESATQTNRAPSPSPIASKKTYTT